MATKAEQHLVDAEVPIEFADEREEILIRQAVQGRDVQDWMQGAVGRWVAGCAVQDQREIQAKLTSIKPNTPWRRRRIAELQQEYDAISRAVGWLAEAVRLGQVAERELVDDETIE